MPSARAIDAGATEVQPIQFGTAVNPFQIECATEELIKTPGFQPIESVEIFHGNLSADATVKCLELEKDAWSTPFQRTSWRQSWQRRLGTRQATTPVTVLGYCGDQAVVVLPLAIVERFGARFLTWHAYQQSDYCAPIVRNSHLESLRFLDAQGLFKYIAGQLGRIDFVYLPKQPTSIGKVANPFNFPNSVRYHAGAHAINFIAGEDWEKSLFRRRSSKTRRRLREKLSALQKLGELAFRFAKNQEDAQTIIGICLDTKSEQLRKLGHWDPFSTSGARDFVTDYFSTNVGQTTWAAALEIDGRPIATAFGFGNDREWLLYQMAMTSGSEARHSPGTHLLTNLMRHGTEIGLEKLDLALGDEAYKSEWCDEHQVLMTGTLAFTMKGRLCKKIITRVSALSARLASDPGLYQTAKWVKGLAKKFHLPV